MALLEAKTESILWGKKMIIVQSEILTVKNRQWTISTIANAGSTFAICELLSFRINELQNRNLLDLVDSQLSDLGLKPTYRIMKMHNAIAASSGDVAFLESVEPLFTKIKDLFPNYQHGILAFINSFEPANGTIPLQEIYPAKNDYIKLVHVVEK